jgi:hypothetical protein
MHRLNARLRKFERQLPQFDVADFSDEELIELARILIREQFRAEVSWAQAYFLMRSRRAQKQWCAFLRLSPEIPAAVIRDWFKLRAAAMVSYYPGTAPEDVTAETYKKLYARIGLWNRFRKCPDWLFRTAAAIRVQDRRPYSVPEIDREG